jgi:ubiquitin-conjugating enzyme E2 G1
MASSSAAAGLLSRQLKQMQNDKSISGISCGLVDSNVFEWEVMLMIDDDTKFYGGTYKPYAQRRPRLTRSQVAFFAHD